MVLVLEVELEVELALSSFGFAVDGRYWVRGPPRGTCTRCIRPFSACRLRGPARGSSFPSSFRRHLLSWGLGPLLFPSWSTPVADAPRWVCAKLAGGKGVAGLLQLAGARCCWSVGLLVCCFGAAADAADDLFLVTKYTMGSRLPQRTSRLRGLFQNFPGRLSLRG